MIHEVESAPLEENAVRPAGRFRGLQGARSHNVKLNLLLQATPTPHLLKADLTKINLSATLEFYGSEWYSELWLKEQESSLPFYVLSRPGEQDKSSDDFEPLCLTTCRALGKSLSWVSKRFLHPDKASERTNEEADTSVSLSFPAQVQAPQLVLTFTSVNVFMACPQEGRLL